MSTQIIPGPLFSAQIPPRILVLFVCFLMSDESFKTTEANSRDDSWFP